MIIEAIKYDWQEYTCYIGVIKYNDVSTLINVNSPLSMNREINDNNVMKIIKYINTELEGTFFPPTILSCNVKTEYTANQLKILEGQLTIIDGQHRIKAIGNILDQSEGETRVNLNNNVLPVLIIEGLESSKHRELFNMINDKVKTVDSNISVRFSSTLENIIGLKFVDDRGIKAEIEWEAKQSRTKVVYLHIVEIIKELITSLKGLTDELYETDALLYEKEEFYSLIKNFLNQLFDFVLKERDLGDSKENFYKKKVFLKAVTDEVCEKIKDFLQKGEKNLEQINDIIEQALGELLKDFVIPYRGVKNVKESTYLSIRKFLTVNSSIKKQQEYIEPYLSLIEKFVGNFYNRQTEFEYNIEEFHSITNFIDQISKYREELDQFNKEDLLAITLEKDSVVPQIIELLKEKTMIGEGKN